MSKKKKKNFMQRMPVPVHGGIRAQIVPGAARRNWWTRRWTEMMEEFKVGARLGRGRSYAIAGQCSEMMVYPGLCTADVQGAGSKPYHCGIHFKQLPPEHCAKLKSFLSTHPIMLARLLSNDLPYELFEFFTEHKFPLFPTRNNDVITRCSCPDYANPCKHLIAVYYILGETISRDPSILLRLRGLDINELCSDPEPASDDSVFMPPPETNPVSTLPSVSISAPTYIQRLGPLPLWRGNERFLDTMISIYKRVAPRGVTIMHGEELDLRREDEKVIITGGNLQIRPKHLRPE